MPSTSQKSTGKGSTREIQTECCRVRAGIHRQFRRAAQPLWQRRAGQAREHLKGLFAEYQANLNLITPAIVISGNLAFDYGCQELTLTPKNGGEARLIRKRFLEIWNKQTDGQWRIVRYIDNQDLPDVVD